MIVKIFHVGNKKALVIDHLLDLKTLHTVDENINTTVRQIDSFQNFRRCPVNKNVTGFYLLLVIILDKDQADGTRFVNDLVDYIGKTPL